jgi:pyridoxal phosphate enzyme (YggS family)
MEGGQHMSERARLEEITRAARMILDDLPSGVILVAAAKGRSLPEVRAALEAGVTHVGHNYVQEATPMVDSIGEQVTWHMIGHLQRNKVSKAIDTFDMIESVDSFKLAQAMDRRCASTGKTMQVLVEVNSGREASKTGVMPEAVIDLVTAITDLSHLRVLGLMTMGPRFGDPENARPYFRATYDIFSLLESLTLPNVTMRYLSMGMTNSYWVAIEERANMVRIGTKIFGPRHATR